jgi:hypothetical protein
LPVQAAFFRLHITATFRRLAESSTNNQLRLGQVFQTSFVLALLL